MSARGAAQTRRAVGARVLEADMTASRVACEYKEAGE
jgi:hypothetical protein